MERDFLSVIFKNVLVILNNQEGLDGSKGNWIVSFK